MSNPNIFFTSRSSRNFWRKKTALIFLICCLLSTIFIMQFFYNSPSSMINFNDNDDRLSFDMFNPELNRFFNQTDKKWYNKKDISMFDVKLLKEIRNNWIISKFINENIHSYLNLAEPDIIEQSMGQAQIIKKIFNNKTNGFFIECGAYDGETRSNTLSLERSLGWTGLLIEADPINFRKMLKKKRRSHLSPTCLSTQPYPMSVSFLMANNIGRIHNSSENNSEKNTMDRAHHGIHVGVQCFPLASYIAALEIKTVDYFSLDIEGDEMSILKTIPFNLVDIKTLSVEFTHAENDRQEMIDYMKLQGYYVHSLVTHPNNLANDFIFVKS
ncbi:hypothetical protein HCN44_004238 [Aphidius gifuensis]|uniref:Methyltransferase FkbM domain-containing protein n=1 Tax=Aphidius gifuensis TaxID=684658 RepID=A0A834XXQ6_APHGI|nr:uncharacterized protein LOC122848501 [Aphidius gifuensis]KAF7994766.1 hypothetical protein HCN44_004238 [Aphidius gifuensis]